MHTISMDDTSDTPRLTVPTPLRLTVAGPALWRVSNERGLIIGHLGTRQDERGVRYVARRFQMATAAFRDLGEFWSADEALQCLRYAA